MGRNQFNTSMVRAIFERDGGICVYCGSPAMEIDHVIPKKYGGKAIRNNGVCVCRHCNQYRRQHPDDIDYLTRAILWLANKGEDTSWIDKHEGFSL